MSAIFAGGKKMAASLVDGLSPEHEDGLLSELCKRGTSIIRSDEKDCYLVFRKYNGRNYWTGGHAPSRWTAAILAVKDGLYEDDR